MANAIIATPELGDGAVLSSTGTVAAGLPLTNLQEHRLSKLARFTSLSGMTIFIDTESTNEIDLVALLGTNQSAAATWQVRVASTQAGTSAAPTYDSGSGAMPNPAVLTGIATSGRWVRIDIEDAANPDGYFDIGRLYVAGGDTLWQPDLNIAEGGSFAVNDDNQQATALSGAILTTRRNRRRVINETFDFQSEDELYSRAYRQIMARGTGRDLLFIRDPAASAARLADQTIYGVLALANQPIVHRTVDLYSWSFTIEELI